MSGGDFWFGRLRRTPGIAEIENRTGEAGRFGICRVKVKDAGPGWGGGEKGG